MNPITKKTHSAGGVVLNLKGEVLVVNQNGNSWSLPKGHLNPGEDDCSAARREIAEESGVQDLELVRRLGTYTRARIGVDGKDDQAELKTMTFFLFKTHQELLRPTDPKNPMARWVAKNEVSKILTHPKDKEFFNSVYDSI